MIENERHPSWVSFVTIFLPVVQSFAVYRQSEKSPQRKLRGLFFPLPAEQGQRLLNELYAAILAQGL